MTGKRVLIAILAAASAGLAFGVSSASATFPGENGLISFSRSNLDGSNSQIWVKSPLTGEEQQLTFGPGQGPHKAWSADGELIVY